MPDLDDLGIDPWEDLGQLPDTVIQTPDPELAGELDGLIQDQIGGGENSSFFSIITDDHSYLVSSQAPFVYYNGSLPSDYSVTFNNYTLPTQIGSGDENMFGSTNLFRYTGRGSGYMTQQNFYFRDLTLSCSLDVPAGAEKVSFKGTMSFYFISKEGSSSPVTVSDTPNKNCFKACSIEILGSSYSGIYNTDSKIFNFDTGDIDISSLEGNSLEVKINFSQSELWRYTMSGSSTYYVGVRFMFTDGVQPTFTVSETPGGGFDEESKGLLRTIVDGVKAIVTGIIEMPGKIASAILDGLKGLFVPSAEEITAIKESYEDLLSERLGFIWQAGEMVISFGQSVLSAFETATDFQFEFPGVSFELPELGQVTLIEPQTVSVNNAFMDVMQPVLGTIVSFICVLAFINTAERMVVAVVSGISYFHFLKGD